MSDLKASHKGLGAKWRALGAGKSKFLRKGKVPAFAMFVKESPKHKALLPEWRSAHKGLGKKWKGMDKAAKAKYVNASKQMKGPHAQQMNAYRNKRKALIKSIAVARMAKKTAMKNKKMQRIHAKKAKASRSKAKKATKRKAKKSSRKAAIKKKSTKKRRVAKKKAKRVAKRANKKK